MTLVPMTMVNGSDLSAYDDDNDVIYDCDLIVVIMHL